MPGHASERGKQPGGIGPYVPLTTSPNETIAAYISLGGFGRYIIDGLATNNYQLVAAGAACVVVLALVMQFAFSGLSRVVVSAGLRKQARQS